MSEWKHRQQDSKRASSEPPPEVGERAGALAAELWTVAISTADRALAGGRKEARSAEKAALQKAARAEGEIKALREQVATFASRLQPMIPDQPELDLASSPASRPAK